MSILTNYSKFIFLATCLVLIVGILIWAPDEKKASASTTNEKYYKCISINENDSLWTIAEDNITDEYDSINDYISEVKSINNLKSDKIYKGATLVIPYYAEAK